MNFLSDDFLSRYMNRPINWGFKSGPNSLGEITYRRTYSRKVIVLHQEWTFPEAITYQNKVYGISTKKLRFLTKKGNVYYTTDGKLFCTIEQEKWWETVFRVVEETYRILRKHCTSLNLPFDEELAKQDAEEMYERIFSFKFTPPGRGLWMMGTDFIRERGGAALNNCAFVSTQNLDKDYSKPFQFLMDMSMLGVGVGFDCKGAGKIKWNINPDKEEYVYKIPDTREGWVDYIGSLINWGFGIDGYPIADISLIRKYGEDIESFGGKSSGPEPLILLAKRIEELIRKNNEQFISVRDIVDIMNMQGACVVAGNVRRTAEISLGEHEDKEFLDLKDYQKNPDRADWGWTSNNSIIAEVGMDYSEPVKRTIVNGEPGYFWLKTAQTYGRMKDPPNNKDYRITGTNPCGEQSLESYELCCLVESYISKHETLEDFKKTLKYAYLYAKVVTLIPTHWSKTNAVMLRNRRIGCSTSGVVDFLQNNSERKLISWLDGGYQTICHYDRVYSEWLAIRESIKKSSIKPSGTVSLLAGVRPGGHYPTNDYHLRRIRFAKDHDDLESFRKAGYKIEQDVRDPYTFVVEFPIEGTGCPTESEVSLAKKIHLASLLQKYWADNQVSYTATFLPSEANQIEDLLIAYQENLKSISFLPILETGAYPQMPYEVMTKEQYEESVKNITKIVWKNNSYVHDQEERSCDGGVCAL